MYALLASATATCAWSQEARTAPRISAAGRWGLLATMAGRYYWYEVPGDDPKASFLHLEWSTPGRVLGITLRAKKKIQMIAQDQLDDTSGKLMGVEVVPKQARYVTIDPSANRITEYGYINGTPVRGTMTLITDGSIDGVSQRYANGSWTDYGHVKLVETSQEELVAAGFFKQK
ncbi:MAG TPA: hypothetical protein VII63_10290 [Caulobacteraceae bacterium]